jgi:hypothetical protein
LHYEFFYPGGNYMSKRFLAALTIAAFLASIALPVSMQVSQADNDDRPSTSNFLALHGLLIASPDADIPAEFDDVQRIDAVQDAKMTDLSNVAVLFVDSSLADASGLGAFLSENLSKQVIVAGLNIPLDHLLTTASFAENAAANAIRPESVPALAPNQLKSMETPYVSYGQVSSKGGARGGGFGVIPISGLDISVVLEELSQGVRSRP